LIITDEGYTFIPLGTEETRAFAFSNCSEIKIDGYFNKATKVVKTMLLYGLLFNSLFLFHLMDFLGLE